MNNIIEKFNNESLKFREVLLSGTITREQAQEFERTFTNIGSELYENEDIEFYVPCYENNVIAMYFEEDRQYIPIYNDINEILNNGIKNYRKANFKELCNEVLKNIEMNEEFQNLKGPNLSNEEYDIISYVKEHGKYSGIIYKPFTHYVYGFEECHINAIYFKAKGISSFTICHENSDEMNKLY